MPPVSVRTPEELAVQSERERAARISLIGLILALVAFIVGYRLLVYNELEQTAALFIGLPAMLAISLTLTPRSRSVTGMLLKGTTLALLLSAIVLQEGFICVLMAAPLFYGVAVLIGVGFDAMTRTTRYDLGPGAKVLVLFVPSLMLSLEGTSDEFSFDRTQQVTVSRVLDMTPDEVETALARTPDYSEPLPFYLSLGFPRPIDTEGSGLELGDRRTIHFAGGEGQPGAMELVVSQRGPHSVHFDVERNDSHIAHWLTWQGSEVQWRPNADGTTTLTWTERWERDLDPAWYFRPVQRYAMGLAIETNIDQLVAGAGQ